MTLENDDLQRMKRSLLAMLMMLVSALGALSYLAAELKVKTSERPAMRVARR
jgi:Tfp pilus assembly protein PilV